MTTLSYLIALCAVRQWTNPVFRNFFLESTAMVLDALPELDGFLNAYAESAWTYDPEKLKTNDGNDWKAAVDPTQTTRLIE